MVVTQPMIKKVTLPFHTEFDCHEFFPVCNRGLHSRFAWESDYGVQMIRHQQTEAAMPDEFFMVMCYRGKNAVADVCLA